MDKEDPLGMWRVDLTGTLGMELNVVIISMIIDIQGIPLRPSTQSPSIWIP
jgi:hypothetical protein